MAEELEVKELESVVVRFSGDSGDGMQLAGNIFSTVSAIVGNGISTFPDYPADIRAPQGSLTGVSGFQVHIGAERVFTPGDKCDVLVAMNAAALKTQYKYTKPQATIIVDTDSFGPKDLEKAQFKTPDYLGEMGIDADRVVACPLTTMVKACLSDSGMDNKSILKCRNMFALGLVCWLFNRDLGLVNNFLREKFAKKPQIAENNIKVVQAGYDYGHNVHASVPATYRIESKHKEKGRYMDITGNKATAYGLIAAAEKAGLKLYLGSYPITPATDILHELAKHKSCGVITVQCEDEISGCASAIGASFAGALAATSTSGPGICLKSEAMNLAVIDELPLIIIDVQRPFDGSAHQKRTDRLAAGSLWAQRRKPNASGGRAQSYRLLRCRVQCGQDSVGALNAGYSANRRFHRQWLGRMEAAHDGGTARNTPPLRHRGTERQVHSLRAQPENGCPLLGYTGH